MVQAVRVGTNARSQVRRLLGCTLKQPLDQADIVFVGTSSCAHTYVQAQLHSVID